MDQAIRNKLRSVVTQCRRLLEESIAQQLQGKYDIYATGKKDEVRAEKDVPLGHLSDEEREARRDILAHFEHVEALGYKPREALEQLIREIAFTHLNRLCAYKMMEVRDVYVGGQRFREAVSKGLKSQGFLFYLADHPEDERRFNAGQQEEAYRNFLNWLGGTLSQEIGVLFSPTDPANRVYPPQRVLDEVLDLLNSEELKGIWSEDETIGWVYQYFTPKELRDQARKESQAPRNSYELAFRNQFFTPRYVVEFLTDNTLGRIWYEMRRGNTRLKDECRYMVRRPGEVFFSDKEDEPGSPVRLMKDMLLGGTEETFPPFRVGETERVVVLAHTVDGYDRHPFEDQVEGEWWPWTKLREIREAGDLSRFSAQELLDVLFCQARADRQVGGYGDWDQIFYEIANEIRRRAIEGRKEDSSQEQLLRAITAVVHRAKKDPREIKILDPACGSGHFLLYGFALLLVIYEEAYDDPDLGPGLRGNYPTKDDLRRAIPGLILRHNLHGIDIDLRCTQIAALALWLRCQRAYQEMGIKKNRPTISRSNIVCAEPMPGEEHMLKEFVAEIEPKLLGQLVEVVFEKMKLAGELGSLLQIEHEIRDVVSHAKRQWQIGPVANQLSLFEEHRPLERQHRFDLSGISDTLFFEQAEAKVVEALHSYAGRAQEGQGLQRRLFTEDAERGFAFVDLCYKRFDVVLMNPPFGLGLRDHYEWAKSKYKDAYVDIYSTFVDRAFSICCGKIGAITSRSILMTKKLSRLRTTLLNRLEVLLDLGFPVMDGATVQSCAYSMDSQNMRPGSCFAAFDRLKNEDKAAPTVLDVRDDHWYLVDRTMIGSLNQSKILYSLPSNITRLLQSGDRLGGQVLLVRQGMTTFNDFRFLRVRAEIDPRSIGHDKMWELTAKGGPYAAFYADIPSFVKWNTNGDEIAEENVRANGQTAQARQASTFYRRAGGTYSRRCKDFGVRMLPAGCILGDKGRAVIPQNGYPPEFLIGILNSRFFNALVHIQANANQFDSGITESLPWVPFSASAAEDVGVVTRAAIQAARTISMVDEVDSLFSGFPSSNSIFDLTQKIGEIAAASCYQIELASRRINQLVDETYGVNSVSLQDALGVQSDDDEDEDGGDEDEPRGPISENSLVDTAKCAISAAVGCVLGRWNVMAVGDFNKAKPLPELFASLPSCPPAALQDPDGLPSLATDEDYPIRIDWDGILVDDPDHPDDILRRVRDVLEVTWPDRADAIEKEAGEILGVADLRDYFRKPGAGGFWDDHIKRYSKSRRKAPIYWLLQSSKKNYALWIYYHRLDKDILFKALLNYVEPKIRREDGRLGGLRSQKAALGPSAKGAKKLDKDIERQEAFLSELRDFEDKLRRAANLHLDPDLNDGVVLNIAPLRELVPWKEAKSYWDDLMDGKYEWSSIAKQLRENGLVP